MPDPSFGPASRRDPTLGQRLGLTNPKTSPFYGLIDSVLIEGPSEVRFEGAIVRADAAAVFTWMLRDIGKNLTVESEPADLTTAAGFEAAWPELQVRARAAIAAATSSEAERRLRGQVGGEEPWLALPLVLEALRCAPLFEKAKSFGRAVNATADEAALASALQSVPLHDRTMAALLFQTAVGQVTHPSRLINAAIRVAGSPVDASLERAGYGTLIEALLAHAQNQLPAVRQVGAFADTDLTCRAIDRFHRLVRAISAYVELGRLTRWAAVIAGLTKTISEQLEPRLRDVVLDVNQSLRVGREGADRLDNDRLLGALNGVYLLATVRECRDSLALNAVFEQTWSQVGQAIELHVTRNLDGLRANPANKFIAARLDAGIKMAELRFNTAYADVLRRARDSAERKLASGA